MIINMTESRDSLRARNNRSAITMTSLISFEANETDIVDAINTEYRYADYSSLLGTILSRYGVKVPRVRRTFRVPFLTPRFVLCLSSFLFLRCRNYIAIYWVFRQMRQLVRGNDSSRRNVEDGISPPYSYLIHNILTFEIFILDQFFIFSFCKEPR